ncbi:YbhB/YbcL family Raf kinase inhibitor-like protein [Pontibacter mangrovi]|uniref:YbhB/YbcL family Raf kinase inhibitor-like protein n=1 Tax=Pontibacter mangrovi TaxID=2589816 RepID=A0A501WDW1_9BACT|nr:YbhB/YbcL family Raf kinase inhibitor-like protein [Pontibacter mangrovi]TPE46264.1 YbhB/YbcL family Raf kinase inhibitor-like protein [Pontibacter mangrovi]
METNVCQTVEVSSPSFQAGEEIPQKFTCDGEDINPALEIGDLPDNTLSLVLIVSDPDAPSGNWTHWLMWNIPPLHTIEEDSAPGTVGTNDFGNTQYGGPCPPIGTHRYFFRVYALDTTLTLKEGSRVEDVYQQMENHIVGAGQLMGVYSH